MFKDVEEYVVSLDRILSRVGSGADPKILVDYVVDRQVFNRLARVRGELGGILDGAFGADYLDDVAESVYRYSDPT